MGVWGFFWPLLINGSKDISSKSWFFSLFLNWLICLNIWNLRPCSLPTFLSFSYYLSYSFSSIGFFSSNHSVFCDSVLPFFSLHTQPHAPWLTSSICPVLATTYIQLPNGHPPLDRQWALQWQTAPRAKHYLFAQTGYSFLSRIKGYGSSLLF